MFKKLQAEQGITQLKRTHSMKGIVSDRGREPGILFYKFQSSQQMKGELRSWRSSMAYK